MTNALKLGPLAALAAAAIVAACSDRTITAPDAPLETSSASLETRARPPQAEGTASVRWNALARDLVASRKIDPPMAARYYAMLSVAQYAAVIDAKDAAHDEGNARHQLAPAAAVGASAAVLLTVFPNDATLIRDEEAADASRILAGSPNAKAVASGFDIGRAAARRVIARAATDGFDSNWTGTVPAGPGYWFPRADNTPPLRPTWGTVRPWLLKSGSQFRPLPPPAFGSDDYMAALREVRAISDHRTPEQLAIATYWADGAGTATPPGHWNMIAAGLIARHHFDEEQAALTLALLNMSLMDAGIACWDAKYSYWLIRPSQVDPSISTPVGLPYFPSYVSGHATFSGAASEVLGAVFPGDRRALRAMADEAALSRLYGGIHYRFDNDRGLELGRKIGAVAVALLPSGQSGKRLSIP
jgi:membrane-associated phospholipid phosphatase